jgi:hypothetical protein
VRTSSWGRYGKRRFKMSCGSLVKESFRTLLPRSSFVGRLSKVRRDISIRIVASTSGSIVGSDTEY